MPVDPVGSASVSPQQAVGDLIRSLLPKLPPGEALAKSVELLDLALDLGHREGIQRVIEVLRDIDVSVLDPLAEVQRDYCLGDAFGGLASLARETGTTQAFWETDNTAKRLFHLRLAVYRARQVQDMPSDYLSAVHNNLGNALNSTARVIPAIQAWDNALAGNNRFPMACGNRAVAFYMYGRAVHDESHAFLLWKRAWTDLKAAVKEDVRSHPEATAAFRQHLEFLEKVMNREFLDEPTPWNAFDWGTSEDERSYRQWCSNERLFLHPLNDLGPITIGAYDPVSTPTMTLRRGEGEYFQGFFNELCQEFVSARFLAFEGATSFVPHFSDRNVTLAQTLDDPAHSLATQKLRLAFRSAASLFDKTAFFVNQYLQLGIPERNVYFRSLWFRNQKRREGIRPELTGSDNPWLRALFALSWDTLDGTPGFEEVSDPDAKTMYELRNYAEHKYLKLHRSAQGRDGHRNRISYLSMPPPLSMTRADFTCKVVKALQAGRELLMYLALMIRQEENRREANSTGGLVVPLPWVGLPDQQKY